MPDLYPLARRILFAMDAEKAHHLTLRAMRAADSFGLLGALCGVRKIDSTGYEARLNPIESAASPVELMGLLFPNRVGLAAGLDKAGIAVSAFGHLGLGHVEIGTVTPRAQPGNPAPRLFRLVEHEAIINRMGFNNPGVAGMLANLERSRRGFHGVLGINIGKNADTPAEYAIDDYLACYTGVYAAADYVTANLSSPNTKGLRDLQNAETCRELIHQLQALRETLRAAHGGKYVPIVIKIAPDLSEESITDLAAVFGETKIDGVITTNTTIFREAVSGHPRAGEAGGLSGAPLTTASTKVLAQLRRELDPTIPIIGSGGVMSGADAGEKFSAGAALVQIYTGLVYRGPSLIREILES
jgi:dihydroorotate dehydrogenase